MQTVNDIFEAFGGPAEIGRSIGVQTEHAASMRRRGRIPPRYWPRLIEEAHGRELQGVTYETLAQIYAAPAPAPEQQARAS